jgi:hypothetical protein
MTSFSIWINFNEERYSLLFNGKGVKVLAGEPYNKILIQTCPKLIAYIFILRACAMVDKTILS